VCECVCVWGVGCVCAVYASRGNVARKRAYNVWHPSRCCERCVSTQTARARYAAVNRREENEGQCR